MTDVRFATEYEREAYARGADAARTAATWIADGNSDHDAIIATLQGLQDGDPAAYDSLPAAPDLSGEWAGDPTPASLAVEITGAVPLSDNETPDSEIIDAITEAFEEGVSEAFETACESELRRWLGIREGQSFEDWKDEEAGVGDFTLEITTGNAAMRTREDVAGVLRDVADRLETSSEEEGRARDENGNTVAEWRFED